MAKLNLTTPPGRFVGGSLTKPNTTDRDGKPLVIKNGPNAGQPRVDYYIAVAIAKGAEVAHGAFGWMATPWGLQLRAVGEGFLAHAAQLGDKFSWKVTDGDSRIPGQPGKNGEPGKAPFEREGHAGHWILHMSNGFQPRTYDLVGAPNPSEPPACVPEAIELGHFVQVNLSCDPNGSAQQPGIYLNPEMVCRVAYGPRITLGTQIDVKQAGFGGQPLPAGASTTPPAGYSPPVPTPTVPAAAAVPPVPAAVPPVPAAAAVPPVPYPPITSVPAAPVARAMSAKAGGATYEQLIAAGWTDVTLAQHGMFA